MFGSVYYVDDTDCNSEPFHRTSCYPLFTEMCNVTCASPTTIEEHYGPNRAQCRVCPIVGLECLSLQLCPSSSHLALDCDVGQWPLIPLGLRNLEKQTA